MNVDFLHNQIIRDTITPKFIESFNDNLVPYLISEYGSSLEEIQFYEDHIASGLRIGGEFFYPITLVVAGKTVVRAVKWQVSNYRNYDKFNPFSYKGREPLEFTLLDDIPDSVAAAIKNKPVYSKSGSAVQLVLTSAAEDKTFLAGKYSQGFVDLLASSLTKIIEREFDIAGLAESGVVIELRFAPGTFMEHIVGNTTYRRLLIKARGCAARDLWIKWTRLDGVGTYTISDNVREGDIEFALAEDVSGKIREKEYRYLASDGADKYQLAMSRKNITEWRDMMRRVIRRGEVIKLDTTVTETLTPPDADVNLQVADTTDYISDEKSAASDLNELMAMLDIPDDDVDTEPAEDEDDDLAALLKSAIGLTSVKEERYEAPVVNDEPTADEPDYTEVQSADESIFTETDADVDEEPEYVEDTEDYVRVEPSPMSEKIDEERIRYEIEQKIRAEMEAELAKKAKEAEELRQRLEEKLRAETREKELLAEAAKAAILEQQRLAKEREEREAREREESLRRAEEERIRAAEEKARAEAEAKAKAEAEARAAEEAKAKAEAVTYVSKTVKLLFKHQIDQGITKRIHEIILATIKYYHKEDVYIKIKANIPDITTVNLEFVKIPENEIPLLVNIIKVLGRSDLGITRAILD